MKGFTVVLCACKAWLALGGEERGCEGDSGKDGREEHGCG